MQEKYAFCCDLWHFWLLKEHTNAYLAVICHRTELAEGAVAMISTDAEGDAREGTVVRGRVVSRAHKYIIGEDPFFLLKADG